ncbi:MAG: TlpA family protein disulfide reductase [Acidimicrobiales bacterium]|nr:TlpA family protein disulfide reductase [Acidimicrobiales bacterium]
MSAAKQPPTSQPTKRPSAKATARARKAGGAAPRKVPVFGIVVAAVLVVGAVTVALIATGGGGGTDTPQTAEVTVAGEPLPIYNADAPTDDGVGLPAPSLTGTSFDGSTVEIADDGRPKIVMFLAHWCPVCQQELPQLAGWLDDGRLPDGVDLYAVSTGVSPDRPNYPPQDWFSRVDFSEPVLRDDDNGSANSAMGLPAFPFWVFIDADGNVAGRRTGIIDDAVLDQIAAALAEGATTTPEGSTDTTSPSTPNPSVETTTTTG